MTWCWTGNRQKMGLIRCGPPTAFFDHDVPSGHVAELRVEPSGIPRRLGLTTVSIQFVRGRSSEQN